MKSANLELLDMELRRNLIAVTVGLVILISLYVVPRFSEFFGSGDVTRANVNSLVVHMTKSEVQAKFGGWPFSSTNNQERWIGYDGCAILTYDPDGKFIWRQWEDFPRRRRFPDNILSGPIQWPID